MIGAGESLGFGEILTHSIPCFKILTTFRQAGSQRSHVESQLSAHSLTAEEDKPLTSKRPVEKGSLALNVDAKSVAGKLTSKNILLTVFLSLANWKINLIQCRPFAQLGNVDPSQVGLTFTLGARRSPPPTTWPCCYPTGRFSQYPTLLVEIFPTSTPFSPKSRVAR